MKLQNTFLILTRLSFTAALAVLFMTASQSAIGQVAELNFAEKDGTVQSIWVREKAGQQKNSDGKIVTNTSPMALKALGDVTGKVTPYVNNAAQTAHELADGRDIDITLNSGTNIITLAYTQAGTGTLLRSNPIAVELDTTGPEFRKAEIVDVAATGTTLLIKFRRDDLSNSIPADAFSIVRQDSDGTYGNQDKITAQTHSVVGDTIRVPILTIPPGEYRLDLAMAKITDAVGNSAHGVDSTTFSVFSGRKHGEHIEFTPYAPPKKQTIPAEGFNPGDFVETRVARLFYFRDAHRVAQIINRNIRSYNQAAVTQAERRAENSRDNADDATDERKRKERAAVRTADQARTAERQLADVQQTLAEAEGLQNEKSANEKQKAYFVSKRDDPSLQPVADEDDVIRAQKLAQYNRYNNEVTKLETRIAAIDVAEAQLGDVSYLKEKVATLQQSVSNLRQTELASRDQWDDAQTTEDRARAKQFRDEVTAAETDPDTYVAGDMDSADPVTQVSISVIGEGLIQLRGPIKGINKIRTMINQIDSPVGQIKIGVFTVQVNGEEGDKMEKVVGDAEGNIDLARFLVNQSLNLLRRSIQSEAAMIAEQCDHNGHYQVDRDRRYLYGFFGRDFIDELYEMNSEFLFSENKLLSLHSMDTVSFNRAMFILALAKNDVRERIVTRFLESAKTELPDAEFDFRRSSELKPHRTQKKFPPWNLVRLPTKNHYEKEQIIHEAVHRNALQRYHFRNFASYFNTGFTSSDTMNPMQREFIRLAQMFKARLVAEMEWKQRVLERGLIEDRSNDEKARYEIHQRVHAEALKTFEQGLRDVLDAFKKSEELSKQFAAMDSHVYQVSQKNKQIDDQRKRDMEKFNTRKREINNSGKSLSERTTLMRQNLLENTPESARRLAENIDEISDKGWLTTAQAKTLKSGVQSLNELRDPSDLTELDTVAELSKATLAENTFLWQSAKMRYDYFRKTVQNREASWATVEDSYQKLDESMQRLATSPLAQKLALEAKTVYESRRSLDAAQETLKQIAGILDQTRGPLDHRKLLDHLIDQQEEKFIELVEGTRSHIAVMDQYLKRLSIALEDDFKTQFYDPAFVRTREAARGKAVTLSQVERTTILTNNRDFAKVDPQATMEFDLPKRQIAIKEAFDAAKALVEDTGALVNDPTFLSAFQMMGGSMQPSTVKNLIPSQSMSLDQHILGHVPPQPQASPGSALQSLVPEPSIFKLETGTGFQLRPVMQPDGDSVVYDFDYMYTTNIREPVRADEKHIGRIKRHYVHTAVQTGNFELREISRYQVALKVSRTSRGVPLLEDIPVVGAVFRPAPSDDSSLQQNIIFGQTNVYATLFDLMGLRWAQQVVDLDHTSLLESEHVIRGRQKAMRDFVFEKTSAEVDRFLRVPAARTDFYHENSVQSPYHPNGYRHPMLVPDPTGRNFERIDRRPPEMQDPPYDRYLHRPVNPERIAPQAIPPRIGPRDNPLPTPQMQSPRSTPIESPILTAPNSDQFGTFLREAGPFGNETSTEFRPGIETSSDWTPQSTDTTDAWKPNMNAGPSTNAVTSQLQRTQIPPVLRSTKEWAETKSRLSHRESNANHNFQRVNDDTMGLPKSWRYGRNQSVAPASFESTVETPRENYRMKVRRLPSIR